MRTSRRSSVTGFVGAVVLAAAIGLGGASAFAANSDGQVSIRLSIADLNMNSEAGARVALSRIRYTAEKICGEPGRSLRRQTLVRECVANTVGRTVATVDLPILTAASQGQHVTAIAAATR